MTEAREKAKFTPGPWAQEREGTPFAKNRVWPAEGPTPICSLSSFGASPPDIDATAQANGRLIAAAPDLYEALKYITRWLMTDVDALPPHVTRDDVRVYHLDGAVLSNCLERARAALSKTQGEEA